MRCLAHRLRFFWYSRMANSIQHHIRSAIAPEPASQNTILLWVQTRQRPAGLFTGNFPSAPVRYHPLLASGMGGYGKASPQTTIFCRTAHLAARIYRPYRLCHPTRTFIAKQQAELLQIIRKVVYNAVRSGFAVELRTPLATISTADLLLSSPASNYNRLKAAKL